MNTDLSGFFFHLLEESMITLVINLIDLPGTPGKVHPRSKFSPFVALTAVHRSPKTLEMALWPFPV